MACGRDQHPWDGLKSVGEVPGREERRELARPGEQQGSPRDAWLYQGRCAEMATFELGPRGSGLFQIRYSRERHMQAEGMGCAEC